jgi:hypothetical protein
MKTMLLTDNTVGVRQENGTWNGVLGLMQHGEIDLFAPDLAAFRNNRLNEFIFSTPLIFDESYALLLRSDDQFHMQFEDLLAGISLPVYLVVLLAVSLFCVNAWLNEKRQSDHERNTFWSIVHSLMPLNPVEWKHQFGVTRKILIATCGFSFNCNNILSKQHIATADDTKSA